MAVPENIVSPAATISASVMFIVSSGLATLYKIGPEPWMAPAAVFAQFAIVMTIPLYLGQRIKRLDEYQRAMALKHVAFGMIWALCWLFGMFAVTTLLGESSLGQLAVYSFCAPMLGILYAIFMIMGEEGRAAKEV